MKKNLKVMGMAKRALAVAIASAMMITSIPLSSIAATISLTSFNSTGIINHYNESVAREMKINNLGNYKVTWTSSNTKVATIKAKSGKPSIGNIATVGKGSTTIKATIKNSSGKVMKTFSKTVKVYQGVTGVQLLDKDNKVLGDTMTVTTGQTVKFNTKLLPSTANIPEQNVKTYSITKGSEFVTFNANTGTLQVKDDVIGDQEVIVKVQGFKTALTNATTRIDTIKLLVKGNVKEDFAKITEVKQSGAYNLQVNFDREIATGTAVSLVKDGVVVVTGEAMDLVSMVELQSETPFETAEYTVEAKYNNETISSQVSLQAAPVISDVKIFSNNKLDTSKAENGDIITVIFKADQEVEKLGNFKVDGSNPDTFVKNEDGTYIATHLVDDGNSERTATFQINVKNKAGLYSQTIEQTSDNSGVTILTEGTTEGIIFTSASAAVVKAEESKIQDDVAEAREVVSMLKDGTPKTELLDRLEAVTAPTISNIKIMSTSLDSTKATDGDLIIITFKADREVSQLGNFKINGSNPDMFISYGSNVYSAIHKVDAGDIAGDVTFQINVKSTTGIYSQTIEQTSDGSSVSIIR